LAALPEEPRFDELENEREGPASDARERRIQELIRQMKTESGISL
jgi:hypothetical protein